MVQVMMVIHPKEKKSSELKKKEQDEGFVDQLLRRCLKFNLGRYRSLSMSPPLYFVLTK